MATGILAAGVGIAVAQHVVRTSQRAHHRLAALSTTLVEGWDAWFVGGFSGLTAGLSWVVAVAAWGLWTVTGLALVGFGVRLITRL